MLTIIQRDDSGYYLIRIIVRGAGRLLTSNNERLFVITRLQTLLEYRARVSTIPLYRQLSTCIDLLAYHISGEEISLVLFSLSKPAINELLRELLDGLREYRYSYGQVTMPRFHQIVTKLAGPHDCLAATVSVHTAAKDWENTRYTSIGFYIDERRGDWMRIWRMSTIFEESAEKYRALLYAHIASKKSYAPAMVPSGLRPNSA